MDGGCSYGGEVKPLVATVVKEGDQIFLVVGPGDHSAIRYELTFSLARKLLVDLFRVVVG